ncbi:MAG: Crp/Fnr family transcriptional regulator [Acidimicrobiales bacterium]|nr:Crp/Fnr family transcriptional regulator [Acidimicrobiales bacterium]
MTSAALNGLPQAALAGLSEHGVARDFAPGEWLYHEGEASHSVHVIDRGLVRLSKTALNGKRVLIGFLGSGELAGHYATLIDGPRPASGRALTATSTTCVPGDRFLDYLRAYPDLALTLLHELADQLVATSAHVLELSTIDASSLIALRLVQLATEARFAEIRTRDGASIVVQSALSQHDLAAWAGVSERSAATALQRFRELGVITTSRLRVEIRDVAALHRLAGRPR